MIIATRTLRIIGDDEDIDVPVRIHAPVEDDRSWRCDYEVGWPDRPRLFHSFGLDAVQALQLVMPMIATELWANPWHHAGLLIWNEESDDYGFPSGLATPAGREDRHRANRPPVALHRSSKDSRS